MFKLKLGRFGRRSVEVTPIDVISHGGPRAAARPGWVELSPPGWLPPPISPILDSPEQIKIADVELNPPPTFNLPDKKPDVWERMRTRDPETGLTPLDELQMLGRRLRDPADEPPPPPNLVEGPVSFTPPRAGAVGGAAAGARWRSGGSWGDFSR